VPTVSVDEVPPDAVILDVREDEEWVAGHIDGATHVPMNRVPNMVAYDPQALPSGAPVVVVCRMGGRSAHVTAWLAAHGYEARNLSGGMLAWAQAGRPMASETGAPPSVV
jgi:rhodanese-related sulfurtransferase